MSDCAALGLAGYSSPLGTKIPHDVQWSNERYTKINWSSSRQVYARKSGDPISYEDK